MGFKAFERKIIKQIIAAPFLLVLAIYRYLISPIFVNFFGHSCRFKPSCSQYSKEAIQTYGPLKGGVLTIRRLIRCHPFAKTFEYDPLAQPSRQKDAKPLGSPPQHKKS